MESRITCRSCGKVYTDPRLTPCLHTICYECLNRIGKEKPYSSHIECPVCKAEILKPSSGDEKHYPKDIHTQRMVQICSPSIAKDDIPCGRCESSTDTNKYCSACELFYCEKCSTSPQSDGHNHRLVRTENASEQDMKTLLRRPVLCDHCSSQKPVEVFCRHCFKCICKDCSVNDIHNPTVPLKEECDAAVKTLQCSLEKTVRRGKEIKDGKDRIHTRLNELDNKVDFVKKEVHKRTEELVALVRKHENDMFQQLDEVREEKKHNLNHQLDSFILSLIQVSSSIDFVQEMLKRNIAGEIANLREHTDKRLKDLSESMKVDSIPVESACIGYIQNKDVLRHINTAILGQISSSNTDALSTVTTLSCDGAVGEETLFTVTTCDVRGEPCHSDIDVMDIHITSPEKSCVEPKIQSQQRGVYQVCFLPLKPGKYDVDIQVNGKEIKGSPFQVVIRPPILMPLKEYGSNSGEIGHVTQPHGVTVSDKDVIAFTNTKKNCIHVFDSSWKKLLDIGEYGTEEGQLNYPAGIAFDKAQKYLIVADRDNNRIQIFNRRSGKFVKKFGAYGNGNGQFNKPTSVSVDKKGRMIVTDWLNHRVQVFNSECKFLFSFGNDIPEKLKHPRDAIFCESQNVFVVSDTGNNILKTFDKKGNYLNSIGKAGSKKGELYSPRGLAVDSEQRLMVCDFDNHRMQFFNLKDRKPLSSYGSKGTNIGQFSNPLAVAVLSGDKVIVTDWRNDRLQLFQMGPMWKMAYLCDVGNK